MSSKASIGPTDDGLLFRSPSNALTKARLLSSPTRRGIFDTTRQTRGLSVSKIDTPQAPSVCMGISCRQDHGTAVWRNRHLIP